MDIVIPYVDFDDPAWQDVFLHEKFPRVRGKARRLLLAPFKKRFASYGLFKYWWRALDANFADVGKVHLLLMQESQYPDFLRTDDDRIVVHYHRDFMPHRALPCFNSSAIELCALHSIELSNVFLLANDDMYFNQECTASDFELEGRPLTKIAVKDRYGDGLFQTILENGRRLVSRHVGKCCPHYAWHHLLQAYQEQYCKQFLNSEWEEIEKHLGQFRDRHDYNHMMLMMGQDLEGVSISSERFPYKGYFECPRLPNTPREELLKHKVICLNDTDATGIHAARAYLEMRYPAKCSFEK